MHRSKGTKVQRSTIRPELMAEGKTYTLMTYALVTSKLALFFPWQNGQIRHLYRNLLISKNLRQITQINIGFVFSILVIL